MKIVFRIMAVTCLLFAVLWSIAALASDEPPSPRMLWSAVATTQVFWALFFWEWSDE